MKPRRINPRDLYPAQVAMRMTLVEDRLAIYLCWGESKIFRQDLYVIAFHRVGKNKSIDNSVETSRGDEFGEASRQNRTTSCASAPRSNEPNAEDNEVYLVTVGIITICVI